MLSHDNTYHCQISGNISHRETEEIGLVNPTLGIYSLSDKTHYGQISWSCEAMSLDISKIAEAHVKF